MLIDRDYLLKKPAGPSAPKLFLDTQIVPLVVNAAGGFEVALSRASARTGLRPSILLAGMTGLLAWGVFRVWSRGSGARALPEAGGRAGRDRRGPEWGSARSGW